MKKILKAAVIILAMAVSGTGAWASNDHPRLTQDQINQYKANKHHSRHQHDKTHKVGGSAARGASQVSPKPVKGN
jgi:hypothetical protein